MLFRSKTYVSSGDLAGNDFDSTEVTSIVTKYTYDNEGNILTITDADGTITKYSYCCLLSTSFLR